MRASPHDDDHDNLHTKTWLPAVTKTILAVQMQAVAEAQGNLSETARLLSRAWVVRPDTILSNWRRWRKETKA